MSAAGNSDEDMMSQSQKPDTLPPSNSASSCEGRTAMEALAHHLSLVQKEKQTEKEISNG